MSKSIIERRITDAKITVRNNDDGSIGVRGYAAVFDSPSLGEVIKRGAFNRTIAQKDNVRFLINHEGTPLASTRAGTMAVGVDETGLWFDIPSLDQANPKVQEFCSAVGRGDMYQCSFAGYFRDTPTVDGLREVREVELVDCSGVTYPWYEDTSMGLTGDRAVDGLLVSARSIKDVPELTAEQRVRALRALRAAPPGKMSYGDTKMEVWDELEESLSAEVGIDVWVWVMDLGDDWVVYAVIDSNYECGPCLLASYTKNADGSFTFGEAIEVEPVTEYRPMAAEMAAEEAKSYTIAEARALLGLTHAA